MVVLEEFQRAGVTDFRFSWTSEGRAEFDPAVPEDERVKVLGVLAAHRPPSAEDLAALEDLGRLKTLALAALLDALLEAEALKPNPPQAVLDWRDARAGG